LQPQAGAFISDPRRGAAPQVGVIAFYYPDKEDACDALCQAGFLGNFWSVGQDGMRVSDRVRNTECSFSNAEAAFQALKFWHAADQFRHASGGQAFQLKKRLGNPDFSYGGYGSNWLGMLAVLEQKFPHGSALADKLKETGDSFLLEHNAVSGRDAVWSDNSDGSGTNWLGLQLMLIRDQLANRDAWTKLIRSEVDLQTGRPLGANWPALVQSATHALNTRLQNPGKGGGAPSLSRSRCRCWSRVPSLRSSWNTSFASPQRSRSVAATSRRFVTR